MENESTGYWAEWHFNIVHKETGERYEFTALQDNRLLYTEDETRGYAAWVVEKWEALARYAWHSYLAEGRTAIAINDDEGYLLFLGDYPIATFGDPGEPSLAFAQVARTYDPRREIVVQFMAIEKGGDCALLVRAEGNAVPPPEAHMPLDPDIWRSVFGDDNLD